MDYQKILYGVAGGVGGFILSGPLVLHEGWTRMFLFRQKQEFPVKSSTFFFASGLIFPILMLVGILGMPIIAGYCAYVCGKESSLKPLFSTFTAPYLHIPPQNQLEMKISQGMLLGYSAVLVLSSFVVLNVLTGGLFGALAAPGAAVLSVFGVNTHSVLSCLLGTSLLSYAAGFIGGAIAALSEHFQRPLSSQQTEAFSTPYTELSSEENEFSSHDPNHYGIFAGGHPFLPGGGREQIPMRAFDFDSANDDSDDEVVIFNSSPKQKVEQPHL